MFSLTQHFVQIGQRINGVDGVRVLRAQYGFSALETLNQQRLGVRVALLLKIELR